MYTMCQTSSRVDGLDMKCVLSFYYQMKLNKNLNTYVHSL